MPPVERRVIASGSEVAEFLVGKHDADDAGRGEEDFVIAAREQFGGARADALRGIVPVFAGDGVRAAGVDDDGFDACRRCFSAPTFDSVDRRRLETVLREDGSRRSRRQARR